MTSEDEGEKDDDDFGDTISLLEEKTPGEKSERKRKSGGMLEFVLQLILIALI